MEPATYTIGEILLEYILTFVWGYVLGCATGYAWQRRKEKRILNEMRRRDETLDRLIKSELPDDSWP